MLAVLLYFNIFTFKERSRRSHITIVSGSCKSFIQGKFYFFSHVYLKRDQLGNFLVIGPEYLLVTCAITHSSGSCKASLNLFFESVASFGIFLYLYVASSAQSEINGMYCLRSVCPGNISFSASSTSKSGKLIIASIFKPQVTASEGFGYRNIDQSLIE